MNLRLVLPPTLAARAACDAIPIKLELDMGDGKPLPPEKTDPSAMAELPDAQRAAAFVLTQWCGGKVASLMQLNKAQLGELVKMLSGLDCFFFANQPNLAINWVDGELQGVSQLLDSPAPEETKLSPGEDLERTDESEHSSWGDYDGPPITVEGSTNFLLIKMSSESHPRYLEAVRLFREWNFVRDRINKDWWWLRDRPKTFDFLA